MNRGRTSSLLFVTSLLVLAACDGDKVAGGTTETDNMATARIIRVDSLLSEWNRPGLTPTVGVLRLTPHRAGGPGPGRGDPVATQAAR